MARAYGLFYEDFVDTVPRDKRVTAIAVWQMEQMEESLQAYDRKQEQERRQRQQARRGKYRRGLRKR